MTHGLGSWLRRPRGLLSGRVGEVRPEQGGHGGLEAGRLGVEHAPDDLVIDVSYPCTIWSRVPAMSRQGMFGWRVRRLSGSLFTASPMISSRRSASNCLRQSLRNSSHVVERRRSSARSHASASCRRVTAGSWTLIHRQQSALHAFPDERVQAGAEVHLPPQHGRQLPPISEVLKSRVLERSGIKLRQDIHVASGRVEVRPKDRSKKGQSTNAAGAAEVGDLFTIQDNGRGDRTHVMVFTQNVDLGNPCLSCREGISGQDRSWLGAIALAVPAEDGPGLSGGRGTSGRGSTRR